MNSSRYFLISALFFLALSTVVEGSPRNSLCLRNCHICQSMYGAKFEGKAYNTKEATWNSTIAFRNIINEFHATFYAKKRRFCDKIALVEPDSSLQMVLFWQYSSAPSCRAGPLKLTQRSTAKTAPSVGMNLVRQGLLKKNLSLE